MTVVNSISEVTRNMVRRVFAVLIFSLLTLLSVLPSYAAELDYDIPNGHFFTQTNGKAPGSDSTGYGVLNADGALFWS